MSKAPPFSADRTLAQCSSHKQKTVFFRLQKTGFKVETCCNNTKLFETKAPLFRFFVWKKNRHPPHWPFTRTIGWGLERSWWSAALVQSWHSLQGLLQWPMNSEITQMSGSKTNRVEVLQKCAGGGIWHASTASDLICSRSSSWRVPICPSSTLSVPVWGPFTSLEMFDVSNPFKHVQRLARNFCRIIFGSMKHEYLSPSTLESPLALGTVLFPCVSLQKSVAPPYNMPHASLLLKAGIMAVCGDPITNV